MNPASPTRRRLIAATTAGLLAARLPRPSLAQDATPSSLGLTDDGSLPAMLARVYDPVPESGSGPTTLITYANIARQLEVRGLRSLDPAMEEDDRLSEWIDGVSGLYLDDIVAQQALREELWRMVGFGPPDIAQTMSVGDPPQITRVYRGAFDGAAIQRALEASGYEPVETDHGPVMSIGQAGEFSADHPIQRLVVNAYNNIAVIDDAYVIASPFIVKVETALAVLAGNEATVANNRAVATLMTALGEELVSATILDGSVLSVANLPSFAREGVATPVAAEVIPPAAYVLFGITPGSMPSRYVDEDPQLQGDNDDTAPRSELIIAVHLGSEEAAAVAAPTVEDRLAEGRSVLTGEPYATFFEGWEVAAVPATPVLKIRVGGDRVARRWLQIVLGQDLAFIYTE